MADEPIIQKMKQLREQIDAIDVELVQLLSERTRCAEEIGKIKLLLKVEVYSPEREKQVLEHVTSVNKGPLSNLALQRLFERIIDESRSAEREKMEIAKSHESAPKKTT
jgi:chorismate mutase